MTKNGVIVLAARNSRGHVHCVHMSFWWEFLSTSWGFLVGIFGDFWWEFLHGDFCWLGFFAGYGFLVYQYNNMIT